MTTIGDLPPNAIGRDRIIIQHEGSTVSGLLTSLEIETALIQNTSTDGTTRTRIGKVGVTIRVGSITLGPLDRDHPCEVIA